jgi:putative ABC transport system permease protein
VPLVFPQNPARDYHYLQAVARLKPGISLEQAQAEMSSIANGIAEMYPNVKKGWGATVDRYIDRLIGSQMRLSLTILMWAVVLVLLIGCANLANLLLARATLRSREIALRVAIGAGRWRIARMLLTESLMLSTAGAIVGIALGYGLLRAIQMLLPPFYFPSESNIAMDGRVLLFLAGATVLTGILFGLAPAIQASRKDSAEALREGGRSNSAGRSKLVARHVFVAAQVVAAFILLVGGGLLIRSFQHVLSVDGGFSTSGLVAGYLPVPMEKNPDALSLTQYVDRVVEEVRAAPGVRDAAVASALPLNGWGDGMPFRLASKPDQRVGSGFKIVTSGYFRALGLPLRAGRYLDERDVAGMPFVVVVNEPFVKQYFPNENPIGKRILVERILPSRRGLGPDTAWEIVGVVADEKADGLEDRNDVGCYASFAQSPVVGLGLIAKGSGDGGALIKSVERALWRVNKDQVLDHAETVEQTKANTMMSRRLTTSLLSGFALLALLLACGGIYGVLSFVTAGRTQEMGIRAAMGASRGTLIWLVIRGGSLPVLAGILVGLGGAMWLTRFMRSMLFAIEPIDVPTLAGVSLLFATVALIACLLPAWRAATSDPMTALRQD